MLKTILLIHRYLGIALSLILLLWCLSGFVMMYQAYPEMNYPEQLQTLQPLDLSGCCSPLLPEELINSDFEVFQIMMTRGEPVMHLYSGSGQLSTLRLMDGTMFYGLDEAEARQIAEGFGEANGYPDAELLDTIQNDQWTVSGAYNMHRPLYKFAANDAAGTEWYVSSRTGEIVQHTTSNQRFWAYLGAVVHWLYPTMLRENVRLWTEVVIWLSILGIFLTLTGIWIGITQFRARQNGRHSPYRGLSLWHHYTGLAFGLLTLSWVLSGLFSMQPWGTLQGSGAGPELSRLSGGSLSVDDINDTLGMLTELDMADGAVLLQGQKLRGETNLFAINKQEQILRYRGNILQANPMTETELNELANAMLPDSEIVDAGMMYEEDNYYFSHHDPVTLPVFRIETGGNAKTFYYLHPQSGELLGKYDASSRWYRWLHSGLHRLDFTAFIRSRPLWDILMWSLLGGVTVGVFTGLFLGVRRVYRSL